jgi:hypothetical protein
MKKWQAKTIMVTQSTDIDAELTTEGEAGWHLVCPIATPFGIKFILERQLDEDINEHTLTDELAKKFGV